jgi:predicted dehydrogenase
MNKVRWGLLSTARINRRLIPAIRATKRGSITAVASRDEARARQYADQWNIPRAFGSYEAMLASGEIDAVYIGLPNHLHAEWSIRALEAGVHVLCEKPFAITLEEVDAMIAASQRTGKGLAEAFMYRHHPQSKAVSEWLSSGRLGDLILVRSTFSFDLDEPENVRMVPEWGGGALWDIGVYPVSLSQFLFGGPPLQVSGAQVTGATGIDESFAGQMIYPPAAPGGAERLAEFSCSFRSPWHTHAEVLGTLGRLVLERPFSGMDDGRRHVHFYDKEGRDQSIYVPRQELYLGEVQDMHAAILEGKPNLLSLEETRNHIRTVLALYQAAREGQVVRIDQGI